MANVNVGGAEFHDDGTDDDGTDGEGSELDLVDDSALDDDDTDCGEEKAVNVESIVDAADDATDIANDHVDIGGSD